MPMQEYFCKKCAKLYEILVPLAKTDDRISCPHCEKDLIKHISAPKIIEIN